MFGLTEKHDDIMFLCYQFLQLDVRDFFEATSGWISGSKGQSKETKAQEKVRYTETHFVMIKQKNITKFKQ